MRDCTYLRNNKTPDKSASVQIPDFDIPVLASSKDGVPSYDYRKYCANTAIESVRLNWSW